MIRRISEYSKNILGWKSNDKIVVFESDDWGSIRMPGKEVRDELIKEGVTVDRNYFTRNDRLESPDDIEALMKLLSGFEDRRGKKPVFTTLNIMGNPDFDFIISKDGREYKWQHVNETYREYGEDPEAILKSWRKGIHEELLCPQFHGREHVNIKRWLRGIEAGFPTTTLAMGYRVTGIKPDDARENRKEYQAAFDIDFPEDIPFVNQLLEEGLDYFNDYFGYRSTYFVPTNGPLNQSAYPILTRKGIRYLNTSKIEREPLGNGQSRKHIRWIGKKHSSGLLFITRNAFFEPSAPEKSPDWLGQCLKNIDNAFKWKKPAVICTHRVNYVAGISEENRENGLNQLGQLLAAILKKWPEVQFMSTPQLGDRISKGD